MLSCGAGRAILGIEANGDLKGCLSLPSADYVGGNVREHPIADIWERAPAMRFTRQRSVADLWGYCRDCYYNNVCFGGCTMTCHVLAGRAGNNPYCHHRALELLAEGKRERLVRAHAADANQPFDHGTFENVTEPWPADELARAREVAATGEGWLLTTERRLAEAAQSSVAP